ncbi:FMN-dependent dehydrogenase, includes L-lactate dehydrogenase and type II isopentenyl diphosphate isomerase [Amycolatopsis arida]|uniref:FMN-dependent dehydrogenase, includes L-lactate dehydrogenase and type II isopentenyl diphosphate isomerase n=1 Tax=Amycolatopsis arida TaxID=587909 RepID=A0A1I5KWN6_9PSEU|nr:lactate 2-monooxygenase [Amycolatopsis arida]TDX85862.1 isopentenyl diphosphate isomerase/L-lactate dehydrogenase-like FMN-dependent dehydrogenase [Amycolatopsis arida]SFO89312.1 FMN-dependent dehydrogenase, includes L-lactate dehydrogenase and type II isopentenyl diphosphate isomerase [Amycolatopsis arida]
MTERFGGYQNEIYLQGLGGAVPPFTTDPTKLEDSARELMDPGPFGYVAGAAGSGATARANRAAFDRWRIVPRMLAEATDRDLSTTVLGTPMPAPVALAPVGVQSIVHPDAERATARAAAALGLPFVLSTAASSTIEEVAAAGGDGPRWFQLYWPTDPDVCASILDRAKQAGYTALVVTLDTWTLAWRPVDLDQGYLPFLRGEGVAIPFSDPVFRATLDAPPEDDPGTAILRWLFMVTGTDRNWDALPFLREHWDGPIVLKGIQHPDDARRAVDAGMDGVVVSNHGGRQVDGGVAALDALPEVVAAVGDRIEVLFDSGVRTGADVLKALALGARAVLLGRPYVYGLAHGGEDGVRHVLRAVLADLDLTMGLSGQRSVAGLTPAVLTRSAG